ncbi:hypothetical protein GCM10028791_41790 [Echinicola sediminis]
MDTVFTKAIAVLFLVVTGFPKGVNAQSVNEEKKLFHSTVEKNLSLELTTEHEVVCTVREKFTVLSKEGLGHAYIAIFYDELTRIEDFAGEVRDGVSGKTIEKLKLKNLNDVSLIADYSVFEDNRLKYFELYSGKFPVELEYEYTTKTSGNMSFPAWRPEGKDGQLVKNAELTLIYPESMGVRYHLSNIDQEAKVVKEEGKVKAHWRLSNLLAMGEGERHKDSVAMIKIAPKSFSMEGYHSNLETWDGLGRWIHKVNLDRELLPASAKQKVAELIDGTENDLEKIKILYQYMQDNYRYVSIQLGIGGLRPMAAAEVFDLKYGDCKALSMFMHAMLKEAGIKSNYTLVRAGSDEDDIDVDFPSNQFNHVILQVPFEADTVWLECTSSTLPAGFLGDFTMDRHVLVVDEGGGKLMKTPSYRSAAFNQIKNISKVELLDQGMAKIRQTKELVGFAAQDYISAQYHLNEKDFQKHLYNDLHLSGAHIENYGLEVDRSGLVPKALLSHETFLQKFYQSTSKRVIITPKFQSVDLDNLHNRNMRWEEEIEIESSENMELESSIENLELTEGYFDYQKQQVFRGNLLKINRTVDFHFPEGVSEEEIRNTLKQIAKLDEQPIFLRK